MYVVLRNDYLSLRRALNVPQTTVGVVLVTEPDSCLDRHDVADVRALPIVVEIPLDPTIAGGRRRPGDLGPRHLRVGLLLVRDGGKAADAPRRN